MNLLYRVIYAAHASGSHHKLALDALGYLEGPDADGWRLLFLRHARDFLRGAKAPDTEFKDFENHVLHVRDGFWGGAVEQSEAWYARLVGALTEARWADAAYSAGVLSHYVVDPMHPFHTGQSVEETRIHRAVEWSIAKSYEGLRALPVETSGALKSAAGANGSWLAGLVTAGAIEANRHYETLIAHYDFTRGVIDPPAGLDDVARGTIAALIDHAVRMVALVLDRAIGESRARPPEVFLPLATAIAMLEVPRAWVLARLSDVSDRREVEAIYAELAATGEVEHNLPAESRAIREHYARRADEETAAQRQSAMRDRLRTATETPTRPGRAEMGGGESGSIAAETRRRVRLAATDPVADAPSIGARTAERLAGIGVITVGDLLASDAATIADRMAFARIDASAVRNWQAEARLAMALPSLSSVNAQLLVGCGKRTLEDIAGSEPDALLGALLRFARLPQGERITRSAALPERDRIVEWIDAARRQIGQRNAA